MGQERIESAPEGARHRAFMAALLRDLEALDRMIETGQIESGVRRIGAEQEVVLVDGDWRPSARGFDLVTHLREVLGERRFVYELARFNAEINIAPVAVGPGMLERFESELTGALSLLANVGCAFGCRPVLAGIVPSIELRDLGLPNISPIGRYCEMEQLMRRMRGRDVELSLKGADELTLHFPSLMLEAFNTSFQVHLQVSAEEFATVYNLSQLLAAPILAACANSPLLLGKRLWRETRIAIFQQAIDTRRVSAGAHRETVGRVRFGEGWVRRSASEIFRTDIARFRLLFGDAQAEDPAEAIGAGRAPALQALALHNGTVYRWNRACYGVTEGRPHLRIENRYLPSGPTIIDELANAALWIGAMLAAPRVIGDPAGRFAFDDAANNFLRAARQGLDTNLAWLDGGSHRAGDLLRREIIPLAREGLRGAGLGEGEIARYLGVVEARVQTGQTGACWQVGSFNGLVKHLRRGRAVVCLTAAMAARAETGEPVHTWGLAEIGECAAQPAAYWRVGQIMSTNLYTVHEGELVDLVLRIMDWQQIRHVLVEDDDHHLVGIIFWRQVLAYLGDPARRDAHLAAGEIMLRDPVTATPETTACEAIALLREHEVSALPVVDEGRLVGIVTEQDFARIAGEMLEERRRERNDQQA
ncbi:MAG: CBS domain-containing protein [Phycisphaerales bacterium]|nr:CBS domain-containing protein [Phycisphaerales bacterium]